MKQVALNGRSTLTNGKLSTIVSFSSCRCQTSEPNMEKAREYLGYLVDALRTSTQENIQYLNLLEFKAGREKNEDMFETAQNTLTAKHAMLKALYTDVLER